MSGPRLELVTDENVREACKLSVRPDQAGFVSPVAWSLAEAYTSPDIAWPRLVYDNDQLVGFMMAAFDSDNPTETYHSYLWRLNIGADYQRHGYGRFAVDALCQEVIRRGLPRLTVAYSPHENGPAGFYKRLGFHPTGEIQRGEVIAERLLGTATADPATADPAPSNPAPSNPARSNPAPGDPAPGNPAPGTAPGNPAPDSPAPAPS